MENTNPAHNERIPKSEIEKASVTVQLGRVLVDLAKAIQTDRGLYYDERAEELYGELRYEIVSAGNAPEDEY